MAFFAPFGALLVLTTTIGHDFFNKSQFYNLGQNLTVVMCPPYYRNYFPLKKYKFDTNK